jgi:hypothetical protein
MVGDDDTGSTGDKRMKSVMAIETQHANQRDNEQDSSCFCSGGGCVVIVLLRCDGE